MWLGPDSSICMTQSKAAKLANARDSLTQLYIENQLISNALRNSNIVVRASDASITNLLEQKTVLEQKIKVLEERLNLKTDKIMLYMDEVDECNIMLENTNKKLKKQKTLTIVTSTITGISIVGIIVSVLIIVLK